MFMPAGQSLPDLPEMPAAHPPQPGIEAWYTAAELSAMRLPGLPGERSAIWRRAQREAWPSRQRLAQGGGTEYPLAALPAEAQAELARRAAISAGSRGKPKSDRRRAIKLPARRGRPKGATLIDANPALRDVLVARLLAGPCCARKLREFAAVRLPDIELPTLRTFQNWVRRFEVEEKGRLMLMRDPDKYRGRYMLALGDASAAATHVNALWELDSSPADLMLADGKRHAILAAIDVYSRRAVLHVSRTSTARAVAALIAKAARAWGLPGTIKMDNGSDYVSHHITSSLAALDIQRELCLPGQPWKKPHVERLFRTLQHDLIEELPGFTGHDITARQAIRAAQAEAEAAPIPMSADDLQQFLDCWVLGYEARHHDGIGMAPAARARACTVPIRHIGNDRALDILLSPLAGARTVTKRGLRVDGARYFHPDLVAYVGKSVEVRLDDADVGTVHVFDDRGGYICAAGNFALTGISRADLAGAAKRAQARHNAELKAEARRLKREINTAALADDVLRQRARDAGKLIELPRQVRAPQPLPAHDAPSAAVKPVAPNAMDQVEAKWQRVQALLAAARAGGAIDPGEVRWLSAYAQSSEYRAYRSWKKSLGALPDDYESEGGAEALLKQITA